MELILSIIKVNNKFYQVSVSVDMNINFCGTDSFVQNKS